MFLCLKRHETSLFTCTVHRDLIFLLFEACLFAEPLCVSRTLVWLPDFSYDARHDTLLSFKWYILPCYYFLLTISGRSFIIYLLRQTNKTLFYPALLITHLIQKSFLIKLVWFKYPSCLMEGIYVTPVAAARVPVSVLPTSY